MRAKPLADAKCLAGAFAILWLGATVGCGDTRESLIRKIDAAQAVYDEQARRTEIAWSKRRSLYYEKVNQHQDRLATEDYSGIYQLERAASDARINGEVDEAKKLQDEADRLARKKESELAPLRDENSSEHQALMDDLAQIPEYQRYKDLADKAEKTRIELRELRDRLAEL